MRENIFIIVCSCLKDVIRPSYKICCTMFCVFIFPMCLAGLVTANYSALPFTFLLFVFSLVSLYCHETAHLLTLRFITGDPRRGTVKSSWSQLWISSPIPLKASQCMLVASTGPLAGAFSATVPLLGGFPSLPCTLLAALHFINLSPFFPDGKIFITNLLSLIFKKIRKGKNETHVSVRFLCQFEGAPDGETIAANGFFIVCHVCDSVRACFKILMALAIPPIFLFRNF